VRRGDLLPASPKHRALRPRRSAAADAPLAIRPTAPVEVELPQRSEWMSRALNVAVASIALVVLAPLSLLITLAIKLTSQGPVLYMQIRVGLDRRRDRVSAVIDRRGRDLGGEVFMIYKFRSMYQNAEGNLGAVWAAKNDLRVTPVGRVVREFRLDELPQLINVLQGTMNIVGPRPERPSIFVRLRDMIPAYQLRQRARPGITGLAQISQAYDSSIEDVRRKVDYDLAYLRQQSLAADVRIMLQTVPAMLFRRGAV
jgi:lipopolysaccharide/colanic/teichoic acid biosynthesis glycosyltransferase